MKIPLLISLFFLCLVSIISLDSNAVSNQTYVSEVQVRQQQHINDLEKATHRISGPIKSKNQSNQPHIAGKLKLISGLALILFGIFMAMGILRLRRNQQDEAPKEHLSRANRESRQPDTNSDEKTQTFETAEEDAFDALLALEDEPDPLAAAATSLANGEPKQAIAILKESLISTPERADLTLNLLKLYQKTNDITAFTALFEAAADTIKDDKKWQKIKLLAEEVIPDHKILVYDSDRSIPVLTDVVPPVSGFQGASEKPHSDQTRSNPPNGSSENSKPQENPNTRDARTMVALARAYFDIGNNQAAKIVLAELEGQKMINTPAEISLSKNLLKGGLSDLASKPKVDLEEKTHTKQLDTRSDSFDSPPASVTPEELEPNLTSNASNSNRIRRKHETETSSGPDDGDALEFEENSSDDADLNEMDEALKEVNIEDPETALTLARGYIDMGMDEVARDFLKDASATEDVDKLAEITKLLAQLDDAENPQSLTKPDKKSDHLKISNQAEQNEKNINLAKTDDKEDSVLPDETQHKTNTPQSNVDYNDMDDDLFLDLTSLVDEKTLGTPDENELASSPTKTTSNNRVETTRNQLQFDDIDFEPHDPETALELARAYIELGDEQTAIEVLREVCQSSEKSCRVKATRLINSLEAKASKSKIENKNKAAASASAKGSASTVNDAGWSDEHKHAQEKGIVLEIDLKEPITSIELANAYLELGEKQVAKNILRKVVNSDMVQDSVKLKARKALNTIMAL